MKSGDKISEKIEVINKDKIFLNSCRLSFSDETSTWILSNQVKGLSPGEKYSFEISVQAPVGTMPGEYDIRGFLVFRLANLLKSTSVKEMLSHPTTSVGSWAQHLKKGENKTGNTDRGQPRR